MPGKVTNYIWATEEAEQIGRIKLLTQSFNEESFHLTDRVILKVLEVARFSSLPKAMLR